METSQNRSSILKHIVPPLYRWMEDTIFQGICDKSEVVWKTCWGKHCEIGEHIGNLKFPRPNFPHHCNKRPFIRYLTHGTSVGAVFTTATQLCITFLPLYNILFSTLDVFAMTIHVASFSLKGSSSCNRDNNGACTEPIKHVYRSTLHCQLYPQLWDGNRPLVSKTKMNEWLSTHEIGKHVLAVSGGTILLGSFRGGENK
jgi:hypothetical protein